MIRWETGRVLEERTRWPGVQQLIVDVDGEHVRALVYTDMLGEVSPGEHLALNTNALRRGLGTGGDAFAVARLDDSPGVGGAADGAPQQDDPPLGGHMMKARYTPMQMMVDAIDDPESPHATVIDAADSLHGTPVVVADLHSSLPAIIAGIRAEAPAARIVAIHTDWAALPAQFSRAAAELRAAGHLASVISTGQAFGGDWEAVSLPSALIAAVHVLEADAVIAVQGPGNLGTGTRWGFSGIHAAEAINMAHALHGRAIHALRVSEADQRPRHRGLSHHSLTVLERFTHVPVGLPVLAADDALAAPIDQEVREALAPLGREVIAVRADGLLDQLRSSPVRLSTMGRGFAEDLRAFLYPALAGRYAGSLFS
ncbi:DUF3866 family protein [Helcobacillus massiliensis]|uniref:DUF3866 family protein n=1 Tax=Helcobacillus massiliensis TaxID=521392 RepID=UPI0021A2AF67|nr:DUF3866 family protein [Helcobacillus massiliensis]MCT1557068.1 DUF3866 family protein [Helcobacillus massiliensis]MCT2035457.1 DUF3866 family protein [Helcobacillus massiliensis]MCT2331328.1 DUF3866 family protein [Helcobacillus massiliensis]MDK7741137.1 DUF3866 family protein [Helcobacillus massiliensis]WOO93945.1 DUF3866 family protein [Helcobacillus massiliensis]